MRSLHSRLAYLGALPFVFCALCMLFSVQSLPYVGDVERVLATYGLAIVSFMAGSLWGQQFRAEQSWAWWIAVLSNLITVAAWLGYLLLPHSMFFGFLMIAFVGLLAIDRKQLQRSHISKEYFATRCGVTSVVLITLLLSSIFATPANGGVS